MLIHFRLSLTALAVSGACQAQWIDLPEPTWTNAALKSTFHFTTGMHGVADFCCGQIGRTLDGGFTWNVVGNYTQSITAGVWHLIRFSPDGSFGVALGRVLPTFQYVMFLSNDGGASWNTGPPPPYPLIGLNLDVPAPGNIIIDQSFNWSQSLDGGLSWTPIADLTSCIDFVDDLQGFKSTLVPSEFHTTLDGGQSWASYEFALFTNISQFTFADQYHGIGLQTSVVDIPTHLVTTDDGGLTWQPTLMPSTPASNFVSLSIHPSGFAIAAEEDTQIGEAHVYLSSDFGQSWTEHTPPIQGVNRVQAADQDIAYLVTSGSDGDWWRWSGPVGVSELGSGRKLKLLPNPTSGYVAISTPSGTGTGIVEIYNAQGKKMESLTSNGPKHYISLEEYPAGVYFVALRGNGHTSFGTIIRE